MRKTGWLSRAAPYLLALLFFIAYCVLSVARYERMATRSWDLAIFQQAIAGYAHLQAPIADIKGPGFSLLGDHFSPLLALFSPFYRVFPTPVTLLVGQAFLIAVSVLPVTRVAIRLVGSWTGVTLGLAYGLSWGLQNAIDFDFHEVAMAVPLLAFSLEALLRQRWRSCVLWALPLVLVKEDLAMTVCALGVVLFILGQRRWGVALAGYGLVSFGLIVGILIPFWNPLGRYDYWSKFGGSGDSSFVTALPSALGHLVSPPEKLHTVFLLLVITAFLALRSPIVLLALPTLAWRFVSDNDYYWGANWHYDAILMPILFMALIDAIVRMRRSQWSVLRAYGMAAAPASLVVAIVLCTQFPLKDLMSASTYQASPNAAVAAAAIAAVPDGTTVESDLGLLTQLVAGHTVFWLGNAGTVTPDYLVIDSQTWDAPADLPGYARQLHPGTTYDIVFAQDGYTVLRRVA